MANKRQLDLLRQGSSLWNEWRSKDYRFQIDLRGACLTKTSLAEIDFHDADLTKADLSGADMRKANLSRATLTGAKLVETDLSGARLDKANLTQANLKNADATCADFSGAILKSANLRNTKLRGANFTKANLNAASLILASLAETTFAFTCLKDTIGLDTCQHFAPSVVDFYTLMESGSIPGVFLRGCGFSDELITYLPSFWDQPIRFYSGFISYSHEDKAFVHLLHDRLQGRGIRCWLDEHQLLPGDDLYEGIDRGIRLWDKVLLCASNSSLTSWWVDGEINRAFQKEAQIMKERGTKVLALIPLNLDGFLFSDDYQNGKKSEIKSRVAANFVGWEKDHALFDRELEKVIRALRTDEGGREKAPLPRL